MIDLAADLDLFLADFGEDMIYTPQGGSPATIKGIFDTPFTAVALGIGVSESSDPAATCKSSDVSGVRHGDSLSVRSVSYTIRGIEPDGTGFTILRLRKP